MKEIGCKKFKKLQIGAPVFIYLLLQHRAPRAAYFYRNSATFYENNGMVDCIGSIKDPTKCPIDLFICGFRHALHKLHKTNNYKYVLIENISDNNIIIQNILINHAPFSKSPTAYYFYNFAHRPFLNTEVFILN